MKLLAIDPGSTHSAYVVIDTDNPTPLWFDFTPRDEMHNLMWPWCDPVITGGLEEPANPHTRIEH